MTVSLAEDAVAIRRILARGVREVDLRRQLAALPTPRVKKFVFVRQLTLRAAPERLGAALRQALEGLADAAGGETLAFHDFPALAVACAEAAFSENLGAWHWRRLGIPPSAGPGVAMATLLCAFPLEAGAAVAALAARGLLAPVWRDFSDDAALRLIAALSYAAALPAPDWPQSSAAQEAVEEAEWVRRAQDFWAPALAALPARAEARRAAAFLALLRWAPGLLRRPDSPVVRALLRLFSAPPAGAPAAILPAPGEEAEPTAPAGEAAPEGVSPAQSAKFSDAEAASRADTPISEPPGTKSEAQPAPHAGQPARLAPTRSEAVSQAEGEVHGETIVTNWGGAFFLINALRRLDVQSRLDAFGDDAPSGWRLLKQLGQSFGLPEDEPLSLFFERQDCDTRAPPELLAELAAGMERLYGENGPWPLPLQQLARFSADETHIDVDFLAERIDLDLRLAGLDLNPGWTPWLGRVVTFHYPNLPTFIGGGF